MTVSELIARLQRMDGSLQVRLGLYGPKVEDVTKAFWMRPDDETPAIGQYVAIVDKDILR